jgi:hypothetical protein
MAEAMGLKIIASSFASMASPPYKSHENLQSGSKGIQRSFIPKASNDSMSFCLTVKYMTWLT